MLMDTAFRRVALGVFLLAIAVLLPACKSVEVPKVPGVTPYRMVIQQGNFISQEMVAQLKPGMTKEQVRFVLGTPLQPAAATVSRTIGTVKAARSMRL